MNNLIQNYYSNCMKADLGAALSVIKKAGCLRDKKAESIRRKIVARFIQKSEGERIKCDDAFVRSSIKAYHAYTGRLCLTLAN